MAAARDVQSYEIFQQGLRAAFTLGNEAQNLVYYLLADNRAPGHVLANAGRSQTLHVSNVRVAPSVTTSLSENISRQG
jgi:hypothetical protein